MLFRFLAACAVIALTVGAVWLIGSSPKADATAEEDGASIGIMVIQVAVQPMENGAVEFGVRYDGETTLPRARYLNISAAPVDEWLTSTPVRLMSPVASVAATGALSESPDGGSAASGLWATEGFGTVPVQVRVAARLDYDGSVEFGIVYAGERILPELRFLSSGTRLENIGRWLVSSEVNIDFSEAPAERVRALSHFHANERVQLWWGGTHINVAQECALDKALQLAASPFGDDGYFYASNLPIDGYPTFRQVHGYEDWPDKYSDVPFKYLMLHNDDLREGQRSVPASEYLIIVNDDRPPFGETWWAARFSCASGGAGTDQSAQVGTGDGQLEPTP